MQVSVEKIDDINMVLSGSIENTLREEKLATLKEQAQNAPKTNEDGSEVETPTQEILEQNAQSELLQAFIETGLKEANVDVESILGQPGFKTYEKREDSTYLEIQVATSPIIDTDISYADIVPVYEKPKANAQQIEQKLLDMALQHAPFTAIQTPRAVALDDVTVIDFEGFLDGVAFEGGSAQKFNLKVGSGSFIPGFEEQLIGMNYGEEKMISVTFPENYQSTDLAGKQTQFKVTLHEIQEQKAITPDDTFAQKVLNDEKASLEMLKTKLSDQVSSQSLSQLYNDELKPKLIEGLLTKFDFTLPINVVDQEIDAKVYEILQKMSQEEQAKYKEDKEGFHALRESVRKEAEDGIKTALIIEALAKKEGLEADEQEVLSALYYQAMMSGQDAQELVNYYKENNLMTSAKMGLTQDKLFGKMLGLDK